MTPLLLVPGMMCDARVFGPQIAYFSARQAVHVAYIGGQDSIAALATEVLKTAPPRFAVAGLSMGGIVAMEMLRQAPERIAGIALLDTNPLAETETVKARREPQMKMALQGGLQALLRDEMKPYYLMPGPKLSEHLDLCMDMAIGLNADVFVRQSIALRDRADQTTTLSGNKTQALILCGRHDRLCPLERHQLMHELMANSRLVIIEQAAHLPTIEQPAETNLALQSWLNAISQ